MKIRTIINFTGRPLVPIQHFYERDFWSNYWSLIYNNLFRLNFLNISVCQPSILMRSTSRRPCQACAEIIQFESPTNKPDKIDLVTGYPVPGTRYRYLVLGARCQYPVWGTRPARRAVRNCTSYLLRGT